MKISVLAAGAWGTALAIAFSSKHQVTLWTREAEVLEEMRRFRENRRFLPGHPLPDSISCSDDFVSAVTGADLLVVAAPLAGLRETVERIRSSGVYAPLVWVCKGLEPGSAKFPHKVVAEVLGENVKTGVLTGPSFAEELAKGLPTAVTLASTDVEFARNMANELHTSRLRIYASGDLIGAEVGGALKNVMAIATGICDGLGFGMNARAALMTRGLAEIARLGVALGAQSSTFMGLAGMGDLVLTCTGDLSRNRRVGLALAQGKSMPQILEELGHVAEGVGAAREAVRVSRELGVEMPISCAVAGIIYDGVSAVEAVQDLLSRTPKDEVL